MRPQKSANLADRHFFADVEVPQAQNDDSLHCQCNGYSAKVRAGRTQAVCFLQRGSSGATSPAVQEFWSRGCRRARVLLWVFACWPLWQLASLKKKKSPLWKSRSRPNRPTRASTSSLRRRAGRTCLVRRADTKSGDLRRSSGRATFVSSVGCLFAGGKQHSSTAPFFSGERHFVGIGFSACIEPMLKPAAGPTTQDRCIC